DWAGAGAPLSLIRGQRQATERADMLGDDAAAREGRTARRPRGPARVRDVVAHVLTTDRELRGAISWDGPDHWLDAEHAETLGLALRGLLDNSARHGALCTSSGRVQVSWSAENGEVLRLIWQE